MKAIILHPDAAIRETIRHQLESLNHVVVHEDGTLRQLLLAVTKHRPHIVVAEEPELALRDKINATFVDLALHVPILWYLPGFIGTAREEWFANEVSRLLQGSKPPALTRYTADTRNVIRDVGYEPFEDGTKQNLPTLSEDPAQGLAREMTVFGHQVECALQHHVAARSYLRQCLLTEKGLRREVAYRAVHSSHKIYWLREHIFRWCGVLDHYLPGVEPVYLPPPASPSPKLDFLHYTSPPENYYAATALLMHGFKPSWIPALRSVLDRKFTGQDEAALLDEALFLAGWSSLLRDIAVSQVRVMECALQPDQPWYTKGLPTRALHRATQTFCDFWNLRQLRTNPQYLRMVADWVVVDGVKSPSTLPVVPPFRHYIETLSDKSSKQKK